MKHLKTTIPFTILLLSGLLIIGCDQDNPVQTFGESIDKVPNLELISGADNATLTVNRNRESSYFTFDVGGIDENPYIGAGIYDGWCALFDTPINSNGTQYGEVKLYSTDQDPKWKGLNYLLNTVDIHKENNNATWKEIQVAIWSLIDFPRFDLQNLNIGILPSEFRDGDDPTFNLQLVKDIVKDVEKNASSFEVGFGDRYAIFAETEAGIQNGIIVVWGDIEMSKGFGVRYRHFSGSGDQGQIYLGVGNLGEGSNRTEGKIQWQTGIEYPVSFLYDKSADKLVTSVDGVVVEYHDVSVNVDNKTEIQIGDVDILKILVYARHSGTTVTFKDVVLNGQPLGEFQAFEWATMRTWLVHNFNFNQSFEVTGNIILDGTFSGGSELSKVELFFGKKK